MLNVFLIHGFRSHCINMLSFYEAYKKNEIHFKTKVHAHNWRAGKIIESKFDAVFERLMSNRRDYADEIMEQWHEATLNIEKSSIQLADKINTSVPKNGDALLVAHSLGTEVVQNAIEHIREDIDIYLFLMAGVANALTIEDLIDHDKRIKLVYNYHSRNDRILNQILPLMAGFPDPIGINSIDSPKVSNIKTNSGHSDYFSSSTVISKYTKLVTSLLKKAPDTHLRFTQE